MMTSNRYFELWASNDTRFAQMTGDAYQIATRFEALTGRKVSKATLYRIKKGKSKLITKDHSSVKYSVKCIQ